MGVTRTYRYEDYELVCSATAIDGGRFLPAVVVCKQIWPTRPRTIAIRRGDWLTEETAIDAARTQGIEWIANYG